MDARLNRSRALVGAGAIGLLVLTCAFASIGGPHSVSQACVNVIYTLVVAGAPVAAYLLGAIGLGALFTPITRKAADPGALNAALGVATMLWLSSAVGSIAVETSLIGRLIAAAPVGLGVVLLVRSVVKTEFRPSRSWLALVIPAALLLAAAINPPGWLWASEFAGFDALSYHLQLPQEWLSIGRIAPLEHNVYSFLPGYVEGAFTHVAVLAGVDRPYSAAAPTGLLSGDGLASISCQLLHAGLAIIAACLVSRAARRAAVRLDWKDHQIRAAEITAGSFFLATPWVIVTGSLAYNEMGVAAMLAGAMIVAFDDKLAPWARGAAAGWLIGVACGCKPTAFLLAGVPLGFVLFGAMPVRTWALCAAAGCVAGLIALAPWLVRNMLASGNPVFPYATSLFGDAHWTAEQVHRFSVHHAFEGNIAERLSLMVMPDADDPAGARHRGLMHPQWWMFFPVTIIGAVVAAGLTRARLVWLVIAMLLAQLALWLATTHVQSRFLLPLAPTGAVLLALGVGAAQWRLRRTPRYSGLALGLGCAGAQMAASIVLFANESGGHPNARLALSPSFIAGFEAPDPESTSTAAINRVLPADASVYLLGDAAPFYITRDVVYNTTWDAWPLGDAVREHPDDPGAWTRSLRARGVDFVVIDAVGLDLFWRSGSGDPDVTDDVVSAWLDDPSTEHVATWDEERKHLVRLGGAR